MTQSFQIGDIVRTKKTGKRCVITSAYTSLNENIVYEGYEYDAPDIPPGTTRNDIPHSLCPDLSTYAEHLILEVPSPWRCVMVDGQPIPMVGELTNDPDGDGTPQTVNRVNWLFGIVTVNGRVVANGTVPPLIFTTF